ncbi:reverse transcriptase domain-containing protein [Tanacetum coccineum]
MYVPRIKKRSPIHHIRHYLSIVDNIQGDGAIKDTLRLRFFHFTMKGKAKEWLDKTPPAQIMTWEQLVSRFLDYFVPAGQTSFLWDMILLFQQGTNEPIKDAWIRFQDLIRQKAEGEEGLEWVVRSKFKDKLSNFMLEKNLHAKGLGEMLNQHRNGMHEQFSQILETFGKSGTPMPKHDALTFAIITRELHVHINLPFLEAMIHMPKGAKVLKDFLSHKEKLENAASSIKLSEECSTVIQRSLP